MSITVMTDKELLELAAKAVGYVVERYDERRNNLTVYNPATGTSGNSFAPLTHDGDALRLAVKLRLKVRYHAALGQALVCQNIGDKPLTANVEDCGRDEYAATRRAIVRAAAEIGKEQP